MAVLPTFPRQAIETKYLGPTNFRGSRVKASAQAGSVTVDWDDALNSDDNHAKAAQAYADKMGWKGTLIGGGKVDGTGNVFVFSPPADALRALLDRITKGGWPSGNPYSVKEIREGYEALGLNAYGEET